MRAARTILVIGLVFIATAAAAAESLDSRLQSFAAWAEAEMKKDRMPGLSVAVAKDGEMWARGFGFADLENRVPAKPESSYRMASVTKSMTAVAALRLAEMGKLDLDAPIRTYVPYFPDKGTETPITIRRLLAHLGGISHYQNYDVEGHIREPKTTREAIAIFADFDLVAAPGERYSYSSYGYNLAGAALEAAAGKPYGELMRELVWKPAGMDDTRMDDPAAIIPNRVDGYRIVDGELRNSEFVNISSRFAGGGTRSTVVDMVRFATALDGGKLLDAASLDAMWWPQTTNAGRWSSYGLGWGVYSVNGRFEVTHSGSQQETRTLLALFPSADLTVALASNYEEAQLSKYRDRLFWLLTGEAWNPEKYASDRRDRLAQELAEETFGTGRIYFDKYGRAMTTDRAELDAAFAAFRRAAAKIETDPDTAEEEIAGGIHPASGQPWVKVGSWIAARLADRDDPQRWYRLGELAFFEDYVERYRGGGGIPRAYRLPRSFERRVVSLSNAWEEVFTPEVAEMVVEGASAAERFAGLMEGRDVRILPSFANDLVAAVELHFELGNVERAGRLGRIAAELYPEDSSATGIQGVLLSLAGKQADGLALLAKSVSLDPRGYAHAGNLRDIAEYLADEEMVDAAIALLENAAAVHVDDVATHVALGDLYAETGLGEKARGAWEKALAIDPASEEAQKRLGDRPAA
ncbi:MAG: serine hydrolase [Thermoanaerobaculia bacterium]